MRDIHDDFGSLMMSNVIYMSRFCIAIVHPLFHKLHSSIIQVLWPIKMLILHLMCLTMSFEIVRTSNIVQELMPYDDHDDENFRLSCITSSSFI